MMEFGGMSMTEFSEHLDEKNIRQQLELPEDIALLDRPEHRDTFHLNDGFELDFQSRETLELAQSRPFTYSDSYYDEKGFYHAGNIVGVYKDALDQPEYLDIVDSLDEWQRQETRYTCGVQTHRMIINDKTDFDVTEAELREIALNLGWLEENVGYTGCWQENGMLAELYGLERVSGARVTLDELVSLKQQGASVWMCVDSRILQMPDYPCVPVTNHAVELLGFDFSDKNNPRVILNDPDQENGRGIVYPLEIFRRAACKVDPVSGENVMMYAAAYQRRGAAV